MQFNWLRKVQYWPYLYSTICLLHSKTGCNPLKCNRKTLSDKKSLLNHTIKAIFARNYKLHLNVPTKEAKATLLIITIDKIFINQKKYWNWLNETYIASYNIGNTFRVSCISLQFHSLKGSWSKSKIWDNSEKICHPQIKTGYQK